MRGCSSQLLLIDISRREKKREKDASQRRDSPSPLQCCNFPSLAPRLTLAAMHLALALLVFLVIVGEVMVVVVLLLLTSPPLRVLATAPRRFCFDFCFRFGFCFYF
ncbi:uncharacterized protein DS421_5g154230 [Arachis hypogaea]|nr:uncharacterized protein DS421_5g154230 [Arachis hypogaea]